MKNSIINEDVKLGKNVKIYSFVNLYGCELGDDTKVGTFVEIQKNSRIGSNATILGGVKIEDNAIIGAGSVVTKDIPSNTIFAGNPARLIRNI